jgi:hypothetical protein
MRLLDKGKEPARYPAHPPLLEHRELTIIETAMLLIASHELEEGPFGVAALVLRGGSATPTNQPAPEFVERFALAQHLASHGSNRPGREWKRQDAVAATWTPVPGSCGAPEVRPFSRSIPLSCP